MYQPQILIEKFLKPWLDQNHPDAAIVMISGSYGRTLKDGDHRPVSSSDLDLIVIYNNLAEGGFKAACKIYKKEKLDALGDPDREIMVDVNVHDFASLYYQEVVVKNNKPYAFLANMLAEGYILYDKTGIAPIVQQKAQEFIAAGPAANNRQQWRADIDELKTVLQDIRDTSSVEEKKFLGTLSLFSVCEYLLKTKNYWSDGSNHSSRRLAAMYPEEHVLVTEAYSSLMRNGVSEKAERLLEDLIIRGEKMLPSLPDEPKALPFPLDKHVPAEEQKNMRDVFFKFMTGHLAEAFESSQQRGELYHLETLSAALFFTQLAAEIQDGEKHHIGKKAMHYLGNRLPDMLPLMLQALDEKIFEPLYKAIDQSFAAMGGLGYKTLQNYYDEDVARVNACGANDNRRQLKNNFKPGYTL